ncbi:MAG: glycosyltransferase family 2 protein [Vicinamibacterales bacterium]
MNPERRIPIVIPTRNAGPVLADVLEAIAAQEGPLQPEVIAIDSGSSDGTLECLERYGARILTVRPGAFNHGDTRNEALKHARGEFAVLLVQDAVPASTGWLSALVDPMREDSSIAGTFARQLPAARASRITTHYLTHWIAGRGDSRVAGPLTRESFARMSPSDRHAVCAFDNVCSCIRLSAWNTHRFAATPIAEDLQWARDVLFAGYKLAYVPAAAVRHSHERSIAYELQRTYLVHQRLEAIFGLATVPTLGSLVRAVATTIPANARIAAQEPSHRIRAVLRGAALGVAQPLGQYLGARSVREGRELLRTSGI